jgi:hypothetical protein
LIRPNARVLGWLLVGVGTGRYAKPLTLNGRRPRNCLKKQQSPDIFFVIAGCL